MRRDIKLFGESLIEHASRKGYRPRLPDETKTKDGEFSIGRLMEDLRDDALMAAGPFDQKTKRRLAQELGAASIALPEGW